MIEKHLLSTAELTREDLIDLFALAGRMENLLSEGRPVDLLAGKILATLFFEPSTRTRFSFETAMQRLGGRVISNADMMTTSSTTKKETLYDTGKVVSQMADIIAMRHPEPGSVAKLADGSDVPVINAGDGPNEHPTQALLDLYTIWKAKGTLDGLKIAMIGDLKYGRVPHSQVDLLRHFDCSYIFVSPEALKMPVGIVEKLKLAGREFKEVEDLAAVIGEADVLAMTRVQMERFESKEEYEKYARFYILNADLMARAKADAIVLHPLPRVEEIDVEVDKDPRAKYFEQVHNGVVVRMALISKLLGVNY